MARFILAATRLAQTAARRTFATSARQSAEEKSAVATAVLRKMNKTKPVEGLVDTPSSSWVPDPVTGYYRPGNRAAEVDPAELRHRLLSRRH